MSPDHIQVQYKLNTVALIQAKKLSKHIHALAFEFKNYNFFFTTVIVISIMAIHENENSLHEFTLGITFKFLIL